MPFIDVIDYEQAEGQLKEIYDDLIQKRGKLAEVHKIQSLNPQSIVDHMSLYMTLLFGKSPLKRYQREMIAVVVSAGNNCEYCQEHHGAALLHYWKDEARVMQLRQDFAALDLKPGDRALCKVASEMTVSPKQRSQDEQVAPLRDAGLSDRAILDAVMIIAYFNFVNRIVLGLGVQVENEGAGGYSYE